MSLNDKLTTPMVRFADLVLGGMLSEAAEQATSQAGMLEAQRVVLDELATEYFSSPFRSRPLKEDAFAEQGIYDPQMISQMLRLTQYDLIGGLSGIDAPGRTDEDRSRAVNEARLLFRRSPLARWGINTWTSFGLGESLAVLPRDDGAKMAWEDFVKSDKNASAWQSDSLADMANHLKVTGNRFLTFTMSEVDGETTMRSVNPDQIVEIITHPEDEKTPLFYKREWTPKGKMTPKTWYYPDWLAFFSGELDKERAQLTNEREAALEAGGIVDPAPIKTLAQEVLPADPNRTDKMFATGTDNGTGTPIIILHIADNRLDEDSLYGWPLTTDGAPWLRSVQRFFEARLAVAVSKAQYTRRITTAGGSRAVRHVQQLRQSAFQASSSASGETNPPPAPGSEDIINKAMEVEELPMSTGSGDARSDGEMFAWMALLSLGLFPHYAGIDTQRFATVKGMEKPLMVQFGRYQLFWSSQFKRIVRIVLEAKKKYNGASYETMDADVSIDKLVELELQAITEGLSRWFRDVLNPNAEAGLIDVPTMQKALKFSTEQVLMALGATEPEALTAGMETRSAEAMASALGAIKELMEGGVATEKQAGRLIEYLLPEEENNAIP